MLFPFETLSSFKFGDMTVYYLKEGDKLSLTAIPAGSENRIPEHRKLLNDTVGCRGITARQKYDVNASRFESALQLKLRGDALAGGYYAGETMLFSETVDKFKFESQSVEGPFVRSVFRDERGLKAVHSLKHEDGKPYFEVSVELFNESGRDVEIDMLASFALNGISPFQPDDGPGVYKLCRYHSFWSAEGRPEIRPIEETGMDAAWSPFVGRGVRFGQRSSLVVKEFFPTLALEDAKAGVTWAAQLATCAPWQLEATRNGDQISIAGGLPDFEFGGWRRKLKSGESFSGPTALLTCVEGDAQKALSRLTQWPTDHAEGKVASEEELPAIFNDYCAVWGTPTRKELLPMADALKGSGVKYFTMDAGWYQGRPVIGDWLLAEEKFDGDFDKFLAELRERGFIPGIWFEFENCSAKSRIFEEHPDWMVQFEGKPFRTLRDRRFLDFRKKEVWNYLDEKVLKFLRDHRIGYLKVDYNATLMAADTENGTPAEGLCELLGATKEYYKHLRKELPELVLEVCASGGHRLTPEWIRLGCMASFSDAHECEAIPLIAANVQMQIPMRQNQVWATLRPENDERRLRYSLAAGFLGRLCVSGPVDKLAPWQNATMREAMDFYKKLAPMVKDGESCVERRLSCEAYNHPAGYQTLARRGANGKAYVVIHSFEKAPAKISLDGFEGFALAGSFKAKDVKASLRGGSLTVSGLGDFNGAAFLLEPKAK